MNARYAVALIEIKKRGIANIEKKKRMALIVAEFHMKLGVCSHVRNFLLIKLPFNLEIVAFVLRAALLHFQNKYLKLSIQNIILIKINKFQSRERDVVININFVKFAIRIITAISKTMNGQYILLNTEVIEVLLFNLARFF
jgi:hypothetical protein